MSLPPGQQLVAPGKWPTVGERAAAPHDGPWTVAVIGLVDQPHSWTLDELAQLPSVERTVDIHCVTRWSILAVPFRGVRLADLLALCRPLPAARFLSFVAQSGHQHSTSLPLADALAADTLLALECQGRPLPPERGGPIRTVVPGRYFFKSLKWLARIELLAEDRLGFWESQAGYHNAADPWKEQRYLAPNISRQDVARLLQTNDFRGRDLRGMSAAGMDLKGLSAQRALLRDADFRGCSLVGGSFDGANLSNAHFQMADLRGATFVEADVEGADFSGADLRGADLSVLSLLGVSFVTAVAARLPQAARLDATTRLNPALLDDLVPEQLAFVRQQLGGG